MIKNEDTKAILARREAFINNVLSNDEANDAKGGAPVACVIPTICLSIVDPCLTACLTACYVAPQPCLTIVDIDDTVIHDIQNPGVSNGF